MPTLLEKLKNQKKTGEAPTSALIALRDPDMKLPDGSSMSLAIRNTKWLLAYQRSPMDKAKSYEFDHSDKSIKVNQQPGSKSDALEMHRLLEYFFGNVKESDVVTILDAKKA